MAILRLTQRPITKITVGGMRDRMNPPFPTDCRPLSTRDMNNRVLVTVTINPVVQVAMRNEQNTVGKVSLSHVHLEQVQHA